MKKNKNKEETKRLSNGSTTIKSRSLESESSKKISIESLTTLERINFEL